MANAVVAAYLFETEGTTGVAAEGGMKLNREATLAGVAAPIPIPPTANITNFSWRKCLALKVTTLSSPALAMTNRTIALSGALMTGLKLWVDPEASYTAPATGNMPAAGGTDDASPGGAYTEITTTPVSFDSSSDTTGSTGRCGDFATVVLGVASTYVGASGTAVEIGTAAAARSLTAGYDEG